MQLRMYANSESDSLSPAKLRYGRCVGNSSHILLQETDDRNTIFTVTVEPYGREEVLERLGIDPHLLRDHKSGELYTRVVGEEMESWLSLVVYVSKKP